MKEPETGKPVPSGWFSANPSKRRGEIFILKWCIVWILAFGLIVVSHVWKHFDAWSYMYVGLGIGLPPIIYPLLFPGADAGIPWHKRFITKANAFVFIYAWIGNYFWTHYFYKILGCSYTLEVHRLNDVPISFYLISHSYFLLYFTIGNLVLRRVWRACGNRATVCSVLTLIVASAILSYVLALAEVVTIEEFPYYTYPDKRAMWIVGSGFYAIYFIFAFPIYLRMDESEGSCWSLERAVMESLAMCMVATQLLDVWRITVGPIFDVARAGAEASKPSLPWLD